MRSTSNNLYASVKYFFQPFEVLTSEKVYTYPGIIILTNPIKNKPNKNDCIYQN